MSQIAMWLETALGLGANAQRNLITSLLVIVGLAIVRRSVMTVVRRRTADVRLRYRWQKSSSYAVFAIGVVLIGGIWAGAIRQLGTFIGLVSAGLAIALKDLIINLAGWAFIMWRRPFAIGDRIQIGDHAGDVIDVRIFQFSLMEIGNWVDADQSTGRVIHVPNGRVLSDTVANFSQGFRYIWNELPVLVTFESDWKKAKGILNEIVERHGVHLTEDAERAVQDVSRTFMIFYSKLTPIVYTAVEDSGVLLTIRYLCDPRRRRGSAEAMWEDILDAFGRTDDIDFAYPTRRLYDNRTEGKAGARAD